MQKPSDTPHALVALKNATTAWTRRDNRDLLFGGTAIIKAGRLAIVIRKSLTPSFTEKVQNRGQTRCRGPVKRPRCLLEIGGPVPAYAWVDETSLDYQPIKSNPVLPTRVRAELPGEDALMGK